MNKENDNSTKFGDIGVRITRNRAKLIEKAAILPNSLNTVVTNQKKTNAGSKNSNKRSILSDVSNIMCDNACIIGKNMVKNQSKKKKRCGRENVHSNDGSTSSEFQMIEETKTVEKIPEPNVVVQQESTSPHLSGHGLNRDIACHTSDLIHVDRRSRRTHKPESPDKNELHAGRAFVYPEVHGDAIDPRKSDPQTCSAYVADIYTNYRVAELNRLISTNFMESFQRDITQGMRGILIDWLVEVTEEYKLMHDTLHLTVNLIDRFLSYNFVEKQRLQLLGVTCMLIASKYEEICAPRIEEFCFITDNTYTKDEVVRMERELLNFFNFRLSVPTAKTFLRRYTQADEVSHGDGDSTKVKSLANYLTELTLVEYSFLKYLPSEIAASAVFLARWTADHSSYPWSPAMEHCTGYSALELKNTLLALQDLQLNTKGCSLVAVREKYKQDKFGKVANLMPVKRVEFLF